MGLQIFKSGQHTDMGGTSLDFTEADLLACAANYDPKKHEAPLVLGHPKDDAPAYGWVKGLSFSEGSLFAEPDQVDPSFAEAIEAGRYKKMSASFYLPNSSSNPVPGSYYLRHVGFLGAQVPAIKGLGPIEFAGSEEDCVTVEFGESSVTVSRMFGRLRDWLIGKFGMDEADEALSSWDVEHVREQAIREENSSFSETTTPEDNNSEQGDNGMKKKDGTGITPGADGVENTGATPGATSPEVQKQLDDLQAQNAEFAEGLRRRDADDVVKGLIGAGKLTPAQAEGLVDFMAGLDDGSATVEFGEGDDKKSLSPTKFMADLLDRLPVQVEFSEQSKGSGQDNSVAGMSSEDLANEAVSYKEKMARNGVTMTTTQAVDAVAAGKHKEDASG